MIKGNEAREAKEAGNKELAELEQANGKPTQDRRLSGRITKKVNNNCRTNKEVNLMHKKDYTQIPFINDYCEPTIADYQEAVKILNLKMLDMAAEHKLRIAKTEARYQQYIEKIQHLAIMKAAKIRQLQLDLRNLAFCRINELNRMIETMKDYWYDESKSEEVKSELCRAAAMHIATCLTNMSLNKNSGISDSLIKEINYTSQMLLMCIHETFSILDKSELLQRESSEYCSFMRIAEMMKGAYENYANQIIGVEVFELQFPKMDFSEQLDKRKTASDPIQVLEAA